MPRLYLPGLHLPRLPWIIALPVYLIIGAGYAAVVVVMLFVAMIWLLIALPVKAASKRNAKPARPRPRRGLVYYGQLPGWQCTHQHPTPALAVQCAEAEATRRRKISEAAQDAAYRWPK
jgi:hypothetical protein